MENITSSLSKYVSRMEFPKSPTLGLRLFATFISDPDDRTQTAFIKLTSLVGLQITLEDKKTNWKNGKASHTGRSSQLQEHGAAKELHMKKQVTFNFTSATSWQNRAHSVLEYVNGSTSCVLYP